MELGIDDLSSRCADFFVFFFVCLWLPLALHIGQTANTIKVQYLHYRIPPLSSNPFSPFPVRAVGSDLLRRHLSAADGFGRLRGRGRDQGCLPQQVSHEEEEKIRRRKGDLERSVSSPCFHCTLSDGKHNHFYRCLYLCIGVSYFRYPSQATRIFQIINTVRIEY